MTSLHEFLEKAKSQDQPVVLRTTDWLDGDIQSEELGALYFEFTGAFDAALSELTQILGQPAYVQPEIGTWLSHWYPESLYFAGWPYKEGILMLAFEHHDREAPLVLHLGYVSHEEIDARRG